MVDDVFTLLDEDKDGVLSVEELKPFVAWNFGADVGDVRGGVVGAPVQPRACSDHHADHHHACVCRCLTQTLSRLLPTLLATPPTLCWAPTISCASCSAVRSWRHLMMTSAGLLPWLCATSLRCKAAGVHILTRPCQTKSGSEVKRRRPVRRQRRSKGQQQ